MSKKAHILAFTTESLRFPQGLGFGVAPFDEAMTAAVKDAVAFVAPRPMMELDRNFIHPIPYMPLKRGPFEVFAYERPSKTNEGRLHGKTSIGFGGHVEVPDLVLDDDGVIDIIATLMFVAGRELGEEAGLKITPELLASNPDLLKFTHVIQSQEGDVDPFHLGIVVTLDVGAFDGEISLQESEVINGRFIDIRQLDADDRNPNSHVDLENWSRLLLDQMLVALPEAHELVIA